MNTPNENDPFSSLRPAQTSSDPSPTADMPVNPSAPEASGSETPMREGTADYRSLRPGDSQEAAATKELLPETRDEEAPLPSTAELAPGEAVAAQETADYSPAPVEEQSTRQTAVRMAGSKAKSADEENLPEVPGYEILGVLGRGGMGVVYKARQQGLKRLVALKMIRDARLAGADDLARFQIEAEAIAALQHPNIVQIYEIGEHDKLPYFSLEFVDGGNLAKALARKPQPARWSAEMLETLARAMEAAHSKSIIHRDLKPANVLMTKTGELKITDFGLAKQLQEESEQTRTGDVMGTPNYMPPEQAQGRLSEIGPVSDVWSLGVILYEALTGRLPFLGETVMDTFVMIATTEPVAPRKLQPKLPRDLETICLKCLEKEPRKRYASAGALADDLRCWLDGKPIVARPASAVEKGMKWAKRNKLKSAVACLGILFLISSILGVINHFAQAAETAEQREQATKLQLTELQRVQERHAQVAGLLYEAEKDNKDRNFRDASSKANSAVKTIEKEAALRQEFQARAEQQLAIAQAGLAEEDARKKAGDDTRSFYAALKVALFHRSGSTFLDSEENHKRVVAACRSSLGIYGWLTQADSAVVRKNKYLAERDKTRLLADGSLLAFILAQETLRERTPEAAKSAEILLNNAARLHQPGPEDYRVRAECRELLGDKDGAAKARDKADLLVRDIEDKKARGRATDYFLLGMRQYERDDTKGAIRYFDAALSEQPDSFWAEYYLAVCYLHERNPEAAKTSLTACIGRDDKFTWNYLLRGYAFGYLAGKNLRNPDPKVQKSAAQYFDDADRDFTKAEELKPTDVERYVLLTNRGMTRFYQQQWDKAIADFEAAIKLNPDLAAAYSNLADLHIERKEYDKALSVLDKAIQRETPERPMFYRVRAKINRLRKEFDAALADTRNAIKFDRPNSEARLDDEVRQAQELLALKRYDEAIAACDAALKLKRDLPVTYQVRAAAYAEQGKYEEAVRDYDSYLKYKKGDVEANIYEARALMRGTLRDQAGAIEDFTRALAARDLSTIDEVRAYRNRGWAYVNTDVPRLGLSDFQHVIDKEPDSGDAYAGRGYCRARLGQTANAVADAEEALRRSPKESRTSYNLSRIYSQVVGRMEEDRGPRDPGLTELRGRYQDRATNFLREALERLPGDKERATFWQESVSRDVALNPIRKTAEYARLNRLYGSTTKKNDK